MFSFIGKGLTIAGSYVGSRTDAVEALDFVARGKVKPEISVEPLRNVQSGTLPLSTISFLAAGGKAVGRVGGPHHARETDPPPSPWSRAVLERMERGQISGRVVLKCQ